MQLDANLSLKKAKIRTHQREAVAEQQQVLNSPNALIWYSLIWSQYSQITTKPNNSLVAVWLWNAVWCGTAGVVNNLDSIHLRCGQQRRAAASRRPTANHAHAVAKANIPVTNVPQKGASCYQCQRKGHYGSQCFSKQVSKWPAKITSTLPSWTLSHEVIQLKACPTWSIFEALLPFKPYVT